MLGGKFSKSHKQRKKIKIKILKNGPLTSNYIYAFGGGGGGGGVAPTMTEIQLFMALSKQVTLYGLQSIINDNPPHPSRGNPFTHAGALSSSVFTLETYTGTHISPSITTFHFKFSIPTPYDQYEYKGVLN